MSTTYSTAENEQLLLDWALGMGQLPPADKRVQIKTPALILHNLDQLYPHQDRSQVITQLALQTIAARLH